MSIASGQSVALAATVSRAGATGAPNGAVNFEFDGYTFASSALNSYGIANFVFSTQNLYPGTYTIDAVYSGETLDGIKLFLENPEAASKPNAAESWLMLRASGTEPLLRVYSESCSPESVKNLLDAGCAFALSS
jgi:hypothetical protein